MVSIPQSGFGAFERPGDLHPHPHPRQVSIPQSGFGAFEPGTLAAAAIVPTWVSIPQSGFGAFERERAPRPGLGAQRFQSLSRDSGRLNFGAGQPVQVPRLVSIPQSGFGAFELESRRHPGRHQEVSIPQSGFGAFEPDSGCDPGDLPGWFQSLSRDSGRLNFQVAIRGQWSLVSFQSLSRDSGRLNVLHVVVIRRIGNVSIPQSGFGAFEPAWRGSVTSSRPSFNPSVGIRGV
mgnify:CR=1 FL=1